MPATSTRSRTIAGDIEHSAVTQVSFDELLSSLETALTDDDGRIGLISAAGDGAFVRIDGDTLPPILTRDSSSLRRLVGCCR